MFSPVRIRAAFSLVELLVVLGILGLLVGLTLQGVQAVRGMAVRVSCQNNLKQIGLASHQYEGVTGTLPPHEKLKLLPHDPSRHVSYTWGLLLTPYLEHQQVWADAQPAYEQAPGYFTPPHRALTLVMKVYSCPSDSRLTSAITDEKGYSAAYGSYVAILGDYPYRLYSGETERSGAIIRIPILNRGIRMLEVTDGLSQTVAFGESPPPGRWLASSWYTNDPPAEFVGKSLPCRSDATIWARPRRLGSCQGPMQFSPGQLDNLCDSYHLWSLHPGGANFCFADSSVRFLKYSADAILPALATRSGGEVVSLD